jgi:hypothetical protein
MDIINNYLENMFMQLPKSQVVKRAKEELLTMMEDKYNELKAEGKTENEAIGIVISEFGNLDELSEDLGIKEVVSTAESSDTKWISMEEAKNYITTVVSSSYRIAIGVFLCICSLEVIIILSSLAESGYVISENMADVLGVIILLVMIAIAVGLFIYDGINLEKYAYLKTECFCMDTAVASYISEQQENSKGRYIVSVIAGVILCILSVIPVIIIGSTYEGNEIIEGISVVVMLVIISIAVLLFITAGMKENGYNILLQKKEFSQIEKKNSLSNIVAAVYWSIITCAYLVYSFITNDWGRSWIIWMAAGIIYGGIAVVVNAIECKKQI